MPTSLNQAIYAYQQQLKQGTLTIAYQGLMDYLTNLRKHFTHLFSPKLTIGQLYQGMKNYSYFSLAP